MENIEDEEYLSWLKKANSKVCKHYDVKMTPSVCRYCGAEFLFCPICWRIDGFSMQICEDCEKKRANKGK